MQIFKFVALMLFSTAATAAPTATDDNNSNSDNSNSNNNPSSHWILINEKHFGGRAWVRRYRSARTNLTVTLAENNSPVVGGLFCLVTEDETDDGTPHTLEHLIFQGSKSWPYKEVLDVLNKRSLAGITNAWTAQDHTCYWTDTAGADGFLNILPVYLDHLFRPTLSDAAFVTEVHHVDGDGDDAGTVYSEMEAYAENHWVILNRETSALLYPGKSSYESKVGGGLADLRNSTTMEKIRRYHDRFYRPQNVEVIVTGKVPLDDLFEALEEVEQNLMVENRDWNEGWEAPFSRDYPMLEESADKVVLVPGEDDERAKVRFAWRMPFKLRDNLERVNALSVLGVYLFSTAAAPFKKAFVNIDEPLASSAWLAVENYVDPFVSISFSGVPVKKMKELEPLMNQTLQEVLDSDLDLDRIKIQVTRNKERIFSQMESSSDFIMGPAIQNLIHGGAWEQHFSDDFDFFADKDQQYWNTIIRETFLTGPRVQVRVRPCSARTVQKKEEEKRRLKERKERLGEEGLRRLKEELDAAVGNATRPPDAVMDGFPAADAGKIHFWPLESYNRTQCRQPGGGVDLGEIPFRFHLDDVPSMFVRFTIFFDMKLFTDPYDRFLLALLNQVWLESPVLFNDTYEMPLEEVLKLREAATISFHGSKGSSVYWFTTKVSLDKYVEGVNINKAAIFDVVLSAKMLKSKLDAMIGDYPSLKKRSYAVRSAMKGEMLATEDYPEMLSHDFIERHRLAKELKKQLDSDPDGVIRMLDRVRKRMISPQNTFVYLGEDLKLLSTKYGGETTAVWRDFFSDTDYAEDYPAKEVLDSRMKVDYFSNHIKADPTVRHAVASLNGTETCHLDQVILLPDPVRFQTRDDPNLVLALEYIRQELFTHIRGEGLAYGANIRISTYDGTLTFNLYRASNVMGAYKVFRETLTNLTQPFRTSPWSESLLKSAFGSKTYKLVSSESSLNGLVSQAKWSVLGDRPGGAMYNRNFARSLIDVSIWDTAKATRDYLKDFKDPERSYLMVTCGTSNAQKVAKSFQKDWDFKNLVLVEDVEKSFFARNVTSSESSSNTSDNASDSDNSSGSNNNASNSNNNSSNNNNSNSNTRDSDSGGVNPT